MKSHQLFLLVILILSLSLSNTSCTKEEDPNSLCHCKTPETQIGAGTISFDLNGKTWSPCSTNNSQAIKSVGNMYTDLGYPLVHIQGVQFSGSREDQIYMYLFSPIVGNLKYAQVGDIQNRFTLDFGYFTGLHSELTSFLYATDTLKPYFMEITKYDTINNVVSGRFFCEMKSYDKTDSLKITHGRFDVPIIQ